MARMPLLLLLATTSSFFACAGHGPSADPTSGDPTAALPAPAGDPIQDPGNGAPSSDGTSPSSGRPASCAAQDTKMQAALDGARGSANDAVLAVKNATCGTSVYLSGDAKYATKDTLWRIGSITKTFTSATVLSLERDGKLSLEDALSRWVPNVRNTNGVTIRMLLNHTSGIFDYTETQQFAAGESASWTPQQLVALATQNPPYFRPGGGWHYSNTNYVLLGLVAEAAGGASIGELVRTRAIAKAGLAHTFFDGEEPIVGTLTRGFDEQGQDVTTLPNPSGPWSAGAIVSTSADLAAWVTALYTTDAVLDGQTRSLLTSNPADAMGERYGLGVEIREASGIGGGSQAIGHTGAIDGFMSSAFYFTDKQTAIVAIVDSSAGDPDAITSAAGKALFTGS